MYPCWRFELNRVLCTKKNYITQFNCYTLNIKFIIYTSAVVVKKAKDIQLSGDQPKKEKIY